MARKARVERRCIEVGVFAVCAAFLQAPAWGTEFVQTSSWEVVQRRLLASNTPVCTASATFADFPSAEFLFEESLQVGLDGAGEWREDLAEPLSPDWRLRAGSMAGATRAHQNPRDMAAWFDREPAFSARVTAADGRFREADATTTDLRAAGDLVSHLARSNTLSRLTRAASTQISGGQKVQIPERVATLLWRNGPELASALKDCLQRSRKAQPFGAIKLEQAGRPPIPATPAYRQLLGNAQREVEAGRPVERGLSLVRLGELQADGLRLGESKQTLLQGIVRLKASGANAETLLAPEQKLLEVLLEREELGEAEQMAAQLRDPGPWLAAIAVRRGDYGSGSKGFLGLAAQRVGRSVPNFNILSDLGEDGDASFRERHASFVRRLLLMWADSALGQEDMSSDVARVIDGTYSSAVPTFVVAGAALDWFEPTVLSDSGGIAAERLDLARSAYLRAESLRRSGFLEAVDTDLHYALAELMGLPGADGLRYRVRLALVTLEADRGQDLRALRDVESLSTEIQQDLGEDAMPWMEAASLRSVLQLRTGDARLALKSAETAAAVASHALPANHSLTMQLHLRAAEALDRLGDARDAARTAAQTLGLTDIRAVTQESLDAVYRGVHAAPDMRRKSEILRSDVGLPVPLGAVPVLVRRESLHALRILRSTQAGIQNPAELRGIEELGDALHEEEAARLRQSLTTHEDSASEPGYGLRGLLRRYPDSLDRLTAKQMPAGVWLYAEQVQSAAEAQLEPQGQLPGEVRLTFPPGQDLDDLELFLRELRTFPGDPVRGDRASIALGVAQAALGGEVLGTVATRAAASLRMANGPPQVRTNHIDREADARSAEVLASAELIAAEAFVRRLRGLVRDLSGTATANLSELRRRYLQLVHRSTGERLLVYDAFHTRYPGDDTFGPPAYEASAEGIQKRLTSGEAAIIWLPLERTTQIILIRSKRIAWLEAAEGRVALARRVEAIRLGIEEARLEVESGGTPDVAEFPAAQAHALYQSLFTAIEGQLKDVKHLYVAPMGPLGALPIELLVAEAPSPKAEPHWVGERFAITRMPTLLGPGVFDVQSKTHPKPIAPILAIGDPVATEGEATAAWLGPSIAKAHSQGPLHARREMEAAARALNGTVSEGSILAGEAARRDAVIQQLQTRSERVLMFVTHGLVSSDIPGIGEPALVLSAPLYPTPDDDGLLRASDIVSLNINADVVMLVACSTAPSGDDGAEPLAGLASAFLAAGARRVLASHWALRSDTAEMLAMAFLNAAYKQNLPPAFALQTASRQLRSRIDGGRRLSHPVFWAPFEVIGLPLNGSRTTASP